MLKQEQPAMDNFPPSQDLFQNRPKSSYHSPPPSGLGSVTSFGRSITSTPSLTPCAPLNNRPCCPRHSGGHPAPESSTGSGEHAQNAGASITATPTPSSVPTWVAAELERSFNQGDLLSTERLVMHCIKCSAKRLSTTSSYSMLAR